MLPKLMKKLSNCKTYFSTWNEETWGITSLEALSHGVPIILNSDENGEHASLTVTDNPNHYRLIKKNDKGELVKAIEDLKTSMEEDYKQRKEKQNGAVKQDTK